MVSFIATTNAIYALDKTHRVNQRYIWSKSSHNYERMHGLIGDREWFEMRVLHSDQATTIKQDSAYHTPED